MSVHRRDTGAACHSGPMAHPTEPNAARVARLLQAPWPASPDRVDRWTRTIGEDAHIVPGPSKDSDDPGPGAIRASIFRGQLVGVHWSTAYPSDAELLNAYGKFSTFVTEQLGHPADEQDHPIYGKARLWRCPEFTVETYAHVQRTDPPTIAALQIHVDLTGPADARNTEDEERERERQERKQR